MARIGTPSSATGFIADPACAFQNAAQPVSRPEEPSEMATIHSTDQLDHRIALGYIRAVKQSAIESWRAELR